MNYYITDNSGRIMAVGSYKFDEDCKATEKEIVRVGSYLVFADEISAEILQKVKDEKYEILWKNYKNYQQRYVDAEDLTLATLCASQGSAKGKSVQLWVMNLWKKYYEVKDSINGAPDFETLQAINLSAESCGQPQYTIRELNEEASAVLTIEN